MSCLVRFLSELPYWTIFSGIFLPVSLLLILMISYLRWKLAEVDSQLSQAHHPRDTAYHLCHEKTPWTGGQQWTARGETRPRDTRAPGRAGASLS
ncbi:hypothetical protein GJAV_G00118800 [Gymnothorax javanicus]|nr:hypothetical protein GJAV_G00118800 [Gymnothorax javanicus]